MQQKEIIHAGIAVLVLSLVIASYDLFRGVFSTVGLSIIWGLIVIAVYVGGRKVAASALDAEAEHELWGLQRFGFKPHQYAQKPIPLGVIVPILASLITLGLFKFPTLLTYETSPLKRRAAKRFGFYSFTEITDWHTALVGASGIVSLLILSGITYFLPGAEALWQIAAYYAFFNMLPISKLDGAQIYFGSRILWTALGLVTTLFATYALIF